MDSQTELDGAWFEAGEQIAEAEVYEEPPRPNLWARFGLALAAASAVIAGVIGLARVLA
jgi:hypothetical protein